MSAPGLPILGNSTIPVPSLLQALTQSAPAAPMMNIPAPSQAPVAAPSAPNFPSQATPSARPMPNVGDIVNGHKFTGGNPADPAAWQPISGDEFLHALGQKDPTLAIRVKAIADGREPLPSSSRINPFNRMLTNAVAQYDPEGYDAITKGTREALRKDMTSGNAANNIRSLNQAIGHLQTMMNSLPGVEGLGGNGSLLGPLAVPINKAVNTYDQYAGHPGITAYTTAQTGLASELAALLKGKGSSNETEVSKWFQQLSPDSSTPQKMEAARTLMEMLKSRLDEYNQQYTQGMGRTATPFEVLNPLAADAYKKLSVIGEKVAPAPTAQASGQDVDALLKKYGAHQ